MAPPTTTRRLLTTSLLIMMLKTSLAHPISCVNETDTEAVCCYNPTIQIFTSSSNESHVNDTTETRVLDALERLETRQDQLTAALLSVQTQQVELTVALASLQSKTDEYLASAEPHLNSTTETRVLDALECIETQQTPPRDCSDVLGAGRTESGVYLIQPNRAPEAFRVYCDMTTDGGGWTVFQRRHRGKVDFYRHWNAYKVGFGDIENEFWIGNDVLNLLTNDRAMQLRVEMSTFENETAYAEYSTFSVSDERDNYRLEVGGYQGTAGDSLEYHNGRAFTTHDADHDDYSGNCANDRHGAWWYRSCDHSNLNGRYHVDGDSSSVYSGMKWSRWKGNFESMTKTEMKVRPL